jgi:hypothetical protein
MTVITMQSRSRDVDELRQGLQTFTRVATALRNTPIRNLRQLEAVEMEIDTLRKALGFGEGFAA